MARVAPSAVSPLTASDGQSGKRADEKCDQFANSSCHLAPSDWTQIRDLFLIFLVREGKLWAPEGITIWQEAKPHHATPKWG